MSKITVCGLLIGLLTTLSFGRLSLPAIISDNMVLQQDSKVPIWGWAKPGSQVLVDASWSQTEYSTIADEAGKWSVMIATPKAHSQAQEIVISAGNKKLTVSNILIGQVWLGSGQSNMEWSIMQSQGSDQAIASADLPEIRLFKVAHATADSPAEDCRGKRVVCSGQSIRDFSAVGFYFARQLHEELAVPMGIIQSTWGGTPAQAWTARDVMASDDQLSPILDRRYSREHHKPAQLYNAMIHPIQPFAIAGVIWYQGESNRDHAREYKRLFPAMIQSWRQQWNRGDFDFYFVQIAPYHYQDPDGDACPRLQHAQLYAMKTVPNTGMVVVSDIGDINDIHPANKLDVGKRLAAWALAGTYGRDDIQYSGPIYSQMEIVDSRIRIKFDYAQSGLNVKGDRLKEFTIAGPDRVFHPANAAIDGQSVVVWSPEVSEPVAVRYCWRNIAQGNLFNSAGLPASPFRTDNWD